MNELPESSRLGKLFRLDLSGVSLHNRRRSGSNFSGNKLLSNGS
jgi:hypothetical protein